MTETAHAQPLARALDAVGRDVEAEKVRAGARAVLDPLGVVNAY